MTLTGSTFDVFISYAHVDNLAVGGERGWVEQFHEHLDVALAKRVGRMGVVKLWWDSELAPGQRFNETIAERVKGSAVFLALTSQGYLESDYCRKELRAFRKAAEAGLGVALGDRSRIFNVLINRIPHETWPDEMEGVTGLPLYDAGGPDDVGVPLDPGEKAFAAQVRKLVRAIHDTLVTVQEKQVAPGSRQAATEPPDSAATGSDGFTVYVADVADSLQQMRRRTVNQLTQSGIRVVTDIPPPYDGPGHQASLIGAVAEAQLAVHLFDDLPGRGVQGDPDGRSYPQVQAELCREHAPAQFVWIPPELDLDRVEDEVHAALLRRMEEGGRDSGHYEFVRSSSAAVPGEIAEMVERLRRLQSAAGPGAASSVLVDTHVKDQRHAFQVGGCLMDNGFHALVNPQEDDPRSHMDVLAERLARVATMIIVFGEVAREWVMERLSAALQLALTRQLGLTACVIYVAPPQKAAGDLTVNQRLFKVQVLDNSGSPTLDERRLLALLAQVRPAAPE